MKVIHIYFNRHLRSKMHVVGRGILTPLFYEDPLYYLPPCQFFSNLPIPSLSPPTPTPAALSVVLYFWLTWWSYRTWCAILLNDIMDLHMLSLGTLVPEGRWCVFYVTRHQTHWGLTHNVNFCWYSDLISHTKIHTNTYTHKDTQYIQGPVSRLTDPYEYICTPPVMCSQQLSLLYLINNSLISTIYFPQRIFFSKIIHL